MLKVEATPNLMGFKVTGDYDDLNELYDAVWALHYDEMPMDDEPTGTFDEIAMSTRLLALCYDLRHAYQGDRHVETVDSGYVAEYAMENPVGATGRNVVYSVEIVYPELVYELIVLNYLIDERRDQLQKHKGYAGAYTKNVQARTDASIGIVMRFQGKAMDAIKAVASKIRYAKIVEQINGNYRMIPMMYTQWLDLIESDWIGLTRKKREQALSTTVRDIADYRFNQSYIELKSDIDWAVRDAQEAESERYERECADAAANGSDERTSSNSGDDSAKGPYVLPCRRITRCDMVLNLPEWPEELDWGTDDRKAEEPSSRVLKFPS